MTELQTENLCSASKSTQGTRCLPVSIENCVAVYESREKMVCGNSSYFVRFGFDAEWTPYPIKTAQFRYQNADGEWVQQSVMFEGTDCPLPVIPYADTVYVGVYAGDITTSTEAAIPCWLSTLSYGNLPEPDDDEVYHQIMEKLNTAELLNMGKVTPQMFGAVGDGITDDTAAFQSLDGKNAYIPEGVYRVSSCVFHQNTVLRGAGTGKTVIRQLPNVISDLFVFEDADNACMTDISIIGTGAAVGEDLASRKANCTSLLKIVSTREPLSYASENNAVFCNIGIYNAPYVGLMLVGSGDSTRDSAYSGASVQTKGTYLSRFTIYQCGSWGMIDESAHSHFSSFTLSDNGVGGMLLSHGESNLYSGFRVEGSTEQGDCAHVVVNQCTDLRLMHVTVESEIGSGIKITQSSFIRGEGSICRTGTTPASDDEIGMLLTHSVNSDFRMMFRHGVYPPRCNVKIGEECEAVEVWITDSLQLSNENDCSDTCFIGRERDAINFAESIRHTPMSLTDEQKAVSRENIGAASVIEATASGDSITLNDSADAALRGLNLYGKSVQDTTTGAQLASFPDKSAVTVNGITWASSGGVITVSGTRTGAINGKDSSVGIWADIPIAAGTYSVSGSVTGVEVLAEITKADGSAIKWEESMGAFTLDGTEVMCAVYCNVYATDAVNAVLYPMLNAGSSAKAWEPYTGGMAAPNPDYPREIVTSGADGDVEVAVNDQTFTVSTPNGLAGVPVTSGGNYTDENGQQWICDEIDFARGVYVQRIGALTLSSADRISDYTYQKYTGVQIKSVLDASVTRTPGLCSHSKVLIAGMASGSFIWLGVSNSNVYWLGVYDIDGVSTVDDFKAWLDTQAAAGTPVKIVYVLTNPIETPLTEEQLAAYADAGLRTTKPTTVITNDGGAGMAVTYAADTKAYIDKKFNELAAAIVSNS